MPRGTSWKRWGAILGAVATLLTIMGTLAGASWSIINDRSSVIQRIAIVEERAIHRDKEAGDRLQTVDSRLAVQDERWAKLEPRLDALAEDVAVSKAILERIERRVDTPSPAVHSLDRHAQENQQGSPFPQGDRVGKMLDGGSSLLDSDL